LEQVKGPGNEKDFGTKSKLLKPGAKINSCRTPFEVEVVITSLPESEVGYMRAIIRSLSNLRYSSDHYDRDFSLKLFRLIELLAARNAATLMESKPTGGLSTNQFLERLAAATSYNCLDF